MTEDTDRQLPSNCSIGGTGGTNGREEWTERAWQAVDSDPDDTTDLDYSLTDWEQFETLDKTDQVIFLPEDDAQIENEAFIVAGKDSVVELQNYD